MHREVKPRLVAVIDAGGTKCRITLASKDGIVAQAATGPCNYATLGLERTLAQLKETTELALADLPPSYFPTHSNGCSPSTSTSSSKLSLPLQSPLLQYLTIGMSGVDRPSDVEKLTPHLAKMFNLPAGDKKRLLIGNDAILLSIPMLEEKDITRAIAVVAGTGSVAISFRKDSDGVITPTRRAGGYGYLLGDDGSGYHVGKMAINYVLQTYDAGEDLTPFQKRILQLAGCDDDPSILLQAIYEENHHTRFSERKGKYLTPPARIASLCGETLNTAYKVPGTEYDENSLRIASEAADGSRNLITSLLRHDPILDDDKVMLVLGGGLFAVDGYRKQVLELLAQDNHTFVLIRRVEDTGEQAALVLAKDVL